MGAYLFSVPAFAYSEGSALSAIPQVTGALLAAYALIDILRRLRIEVPLDIGLYGFMGLWAGTTYILGASTSGWTSLGSLIKVVIATIACAQLIKNETDLFTALKMFVVSIVLVYYQNMGDLRYLRVADKISETDRFAGTLANANTAAIFALTVIWVSILLVLHVRKGLLERVWVLVPVGISLIIIYYSGSKKGLVGLGLFVLFLTRLMYMRQKASFYKKGLVLLISAALIILAGYFIYTSPFFFRMEQLFRGGSGSDINRFNLAQEALQVWLMNWKTFIMGVGYDNFRLFSSLQTYSHSTPFELLASNGIVGFGAFMGFFYLLFRKNMWLYRHARDQYLKSLSYATIVFLSIFFYFMIASVLHDSRKLLPILGCLSAFGQYQVYALRRNTGETSPGPDGETAFEESGLRPDSDPT